jgi:predicted enzyme related to lactoylglutathione lyase
MLSDHPVFPILLATDLDAARTFYHDVLGLEIVREDHDDRIVFRTGGGTQLVVTKSTVGTSDTQTQMAWRVPDIQAALADLRARGVRIEEYVAPDPVTTDGVADMGHSWAAWFIDPSRNVLAVVQPKGGRSGDPGAGRRVRGRCTPAASRREVGVSVRRQVNPSW